jgi:serine/threonine protein kinase
MKKTNKNIKTKGTKKGPKKIKRAKNTTKTKRAGIKKGGLFIKKGTYGSVYSKPRMLCKGETLDTLGINSEVSKLFEYDSKAISEITNTNELKDLNLPDLEKYAIIPKRMCDIDRDSLRENPYNTDEWKQNKNGQYNSSVLNDTIVDVPTEIKVTDEDDEIYIKAYNKLIISDEGGDDLYEIIKKIQTYNDFKSFLQKLTSIGKGIQLLQNNGLIHGDIKVENCIEHEDTFKIIDLSDVRKISTTKYPAAMPTAFGYHIWPITAFYTYLFERNVNFNNINDINAIITVEQIEQNYNERMKYNNGSIDYVKSLFFSAFNVSGVGYTVEQMKKIVNFKMNLLLQKDTTVKNNQLQRIIPVFNEMFIKTFNDINEFKMDLFKRIDIYSFGIMILGCISQYLNYAAQKPMDDNKRENIIKLYEIAYKCCYQEERVANIDTIISNYETLVNSMM